jgi:hypothetical protein
MLSAKWGLQGGCYGLAVALLVLTAVPALAFNPNLPYDPTTPPYNSSVGYAADDSPPPTIPIAMNPTITIQTTPLDPNDRYLDNQLFGNIFGSDGKAYFGSSTHSDLSTGAMFFDYDPNTGKINTLSSGMTAIGGEPPPPAIPQGKLHCLPYEYNGWIYFTCHLAVYSTTGYNNYPGSHIYAYKMGSAEANAPVWKDFGVMRTDYTSYAALSIDPVHNYVYSSVTNWWTAGANIGYLYRYNLDGTGKTQVASNIGTDFFQYVDGRGDMWFADDHNPGTLHKISGATGVMTDYPNALPTPRNLTSNTVNTTDNAGRYFASGWKVDGNTCMFSMGWDGAMWEFNSAKFEAGDPNAFTMAKWIGAHGGGMTLANNTVYYAQSADPNWTNGAKAYDLHLKSFSLTNTAAAVTDWGRIVDQSGRTPYRIEGMSADANGHVYMSGDWRIIDTPTPDPVNYRSLRRQFDYYGNWLDLYRGQMFGTVTVPEPTCLALLLAGVAFLRRRRA